MLEDRSAKQRTEIVEKDPNCFINDNNEHGHAIPSASTVFNGDGETAKEKGTSRGWHPLQHEATSIR